MRESFRSLEGKEHVSLLSRCSIIIDNDKVKTYKQYMFHVIRNLRMESLLRQTVHSWLCLRRAYTLKNTDSA